MLESRENRASVEQSHRFCRKVRFLGQNPKIEYQEFNELQTLKRSKKQLCDRTGNLLSNVLNDPGTLLHILSCKESLSANARFLHIDPYLHFSSLAYWSRLFCRRRLMRGTCSSRTSLKRSSMIDLVASFATRSHLLKYEEKTMHVRRVHTGSATQVMLARSCWIPGSYPYSATSKGTLKLPSVQRRCAIADPSPSSCHHRECDALG